MRNPIVLLLLSCTADKLGDSGSTGVLPTDDTDACAPQTWWWDEDGDGYGSSARAGVACEAPEGAVADHDDCDDSDARRFPGAEEVCEDGVSNDCSDPEGEVAYETCGIAGSYSLGQVDTKLRGEQAGDQSSHVGAPGDVNGDGLDDMMVFTERRGLFYMVYGPVSGPRELSEADAVMGGADVKSLLLMRHTWVGDPDLDGYDDVLASAIHAEGPTVFYWSGPLYGPSGFDEANGTISYDGPDAELGPGLGASLAGVGDTNGDGWGEAMIGADGVNVEGVESEEGACAGEDAAAELEVAEEYPPGTDVGVVWLTTLTLEGEFDLDDADARLYGEDTLDYAGHQMSTLGDWDGDGVPDLFVSAAKNCEAGVGAGAAYVVLSPVSGDVPLSEADLKLLGDQGWWLESASPMRSAGDVNGDGYPDALIGLPYRDVDGVNDSGTVYLALGGQSGKKALQDLETRFEGREPSDQMGRSVSSAGDLDGDGGDEVVLEATLAFAEYPGAILVYFGPLSGTYVAEDSERVFRGPYHDQGVGPTALLGNTDSDGRPDLIIGAPDSTNGEDAGGAWILLAGGEGLLPSPGM